MWRPFRTAGWLAAAAILGLSVPALAAPSAHTTFGRQLNAAACSGSGAPVLDVTLKVTNDADSGLAGNTWALDHYAKHIQVWAQNGAYCAVVSYAGGFTTLAGTSPGGTGTLAAGVTGTLEGGYTAVFDGTFSPNGPTRGSLGSFDYGCEADPSCPGIFPWLSTYFAHTTYFNQPYWAWNYHAGSNGSWVNASTGTFGDITGSPHH